MTAAAVESGIEWPPGVQPPEGLTDTEIGGIGMAKPSRCAVADCDRSIFSREWCQKHYARWLRHGDPLVTKSSRDVPLMQRVAPLIEKHPSGCWLWTGPLNRSGYASRRMEKGRSSLLHRWLYEQLVGPVDPALHLDHLCRVRNCVNPDHLEPVTPGENTRRSMAPAAIAVRTGLCKRGHDLAVHGYVRKDRRGRNCMECQRIGQRRRAAERERQS